MQSSDSSQIPVNAGTALSYKQRCILGMIFISAFAFQVWSIDTPYMLQYETGFQEQIALRHLDPGIGVTHGISTITNLGQEPSYHPTHPPGLQWILALLYACFGVSERVARLIPLLSYLFSMLAMWRLTENKCTNDVRLGILIAFAFNPLSLHLGRIVNFEPLTLACILWTAVGLQTKSNWMLVVLAILGTLTDWPYALFVTVVFTASFFLSPQTLNRKSVWMVWLVTMVVAMLYFGFVMSVGALDNVLHHVKIQSGAFTPAAGFIFPFFFRFSWWMSLISRVWIYATPVLFLAAMIGPLWYAVRNKKLNENVIWIAIFVMFNAAYLLIFSRASYQHFWCLFYLVPTLALAFGLLLQCIPQKIHPILIVVLLICSYFPTAELRGRTPLRAVMQIGKSIQSITESLPNAYTSRMNGPLVYANRVDPMGYYSGFDTAYFYLSIGASLPHRFLVRYRPEYVVLSGLGSRTAVSVRNDDIRDLYERLEQSYTLVHEQYNTQLWESNWSPHVSLMGLISPGGNRPIQKEILQDGSGVHIAAHVHGGNPAMRIDVGSLWKSGRRWLYGWVLAHQISSSQAINIEVQSEKGNRIGTFSVQPETAPAQWQPFRLYLGYLPNRLTLSWNGPKLIFGDLRLYSETLWTQDITRVLGGEIRRMMGPKPYQDTIRLRMDDEILFPVSQRLGVGVDRVQLPPIRLNGQPSLQVEYGLHPDGLSNGRPVVFRLHMRDYPDGKPYVLFEDVMALEEAGQRRNRKIDLQANARHLVSFTFEIECEQNPSIVNTDAALWYHANISGIQ